MQSKFLKLYKLVMESNNKQNKIGSDITEALPCLFFNAHYNIIPENPVELKKLLIQILNIPNILETFKYNTFKIYTIENILNTISNTWMIYDLFSDKIKQANQILQKLNSFIITNNYNNAFAYWTNLSKGEGAKPIGFPSTTTADICVNYNNDQWFGISLKAQKSNGKAGIQNPSLDSFLTYFLGNDAIIFENQLGSYIWNNIYKPYFEHYLQICNNIQKTILQPLIIKTDETDFLNKSIKGNWKKLFDTFLKLTQNETDKFKNLNNFRTGPFLQAKDIFLDLIVAKINSIDYEIQKKGFLQCVDQNGGGWPVYIWKADNISIKDLTNEMNYEIPNLIKSGNITFIKKTNVQCALLINNNEILSFEFRHSHSKKEFFGTQYTYNGSSTSSMFMIPLFDKVFIKV